MKTNILKLIWKYIVDSDFRFLAMGKYGLLNYMDDEKYLRRMYRINMGKELDLIIPKLFNEKLQWLKLYDRKPIYTTMVDKYAAKKYVGEIIGNEYIIPTIGVWNSAEDIDFNALPNQFVLKCTHDSHGLVICKDKHNLDIPAARNKLKRALKRNYYYQFREWPYKNVPPRIIAEQYMSDNSVALPENLKIKSCDESQLQQLKNSKFGLTDYKFMCFNGHVKCVFTVTERFSEDGLKVTFFDREWNPLPFERHYPKSTKPIPKPYHLEKMIELAERLSDGIPFVRVDFYVSGGHIYFGEMTFYPGSGFEEFSPKEWDKTYGDMIELPSRK